MKQELIHNCLVDGSDEVIAGKGKNIIPPPEKEPLWKGFLEKFKDPLIIVLGIVFLFSVGVSIYNYSNHGDATVLLEPIGIFVAMMLATGVGFIFEVKADKEFDILNKVKDSRRIKVLRCKQKGAEPVVKEIKKSDVCVGDIVKLESGDEIPADGQLLESLALKVDESAFTGESYAKKSVERDETSEAAYPSDFLLRGSTVIEGSGTIRITAIGMNTEEGKGVAKTQEGSDVKTPLNQQLERLGNGISVLSFAIGLLIIAGRLIYYYFFDGDPHNNTDFLETLEYILSSIMIAVTLVVCAVPEGLPMSVTVSLAMSMRKMLKENNLVRKLHACETMGAATVICTDKTGTLTKNEMTVVEFEELGSSNENAKCNHESAEVNSDETDGNHRIAELFARSIAINSTAELTEEDGELRRIGNPTECALLMWIKSQGYDYRTFRKEAQVVDQQPFSTNTKFMSTSTSDGHIYLKGATEILLDKCTKIAGGWSREQIFERLYEYQSKAMRTLGFAIDDTFVGFVGIADPIREDVAEAIHICRDNAGVRVIIVTGDTPGTAKEIGRQIGLITSENDYVLTGTEFAAMTDEEALEAVKTLKIISRAKPDDKARLVTLLQRNGEVVAVTGDGTNDAPALSKAQVGLSMGDGTSRAKEASDITIIDNSFSSINKAIMWGRSLYQNIRRFIIFQTTINLCACLIVLYGAFTGKESPLGVTQMLWINLIMDTFAAMALSSLPADESVLTVKPRDPKSNIIDRKMAITILGWGSVFFIAFALIWHMADLRKYFFSIFVIAQFWNIFNARYFNTHDSLIGDITNLFANREAFRDNTSLSFYSIAAAILIGQILIVTYGGQMFEIPEPLSFTEWMKIMLFTSPILIIPDIYRFIKK